VLKKRRSVLHFSDSWSHVLEGLHHWDGAVGLVNKLQNDHLGEIIVIALEGLLERGDVDQVGVEVHFLL